MNIIINKEVEDFLKISCQNVSAIEKESSIKVIGEIISTRTNKKIKDDITLSVVLYNAEHKVIDSDECRIYASDFFKETLFSIQFFDIKSKIESIKVYFKYY